MKLKRRVKYLVFIPDFWWVPKLKKWISVDELDYKTYIFYSTQKFKSCKCKYKQWPKGTIITKIEIGARRRRYVEYEVR